MVALDLDACLERLYKKQLLAECVLKEICERTKELLMSESNVVHISAPVTVVGDIHGQYYDLIEIFRIGGYCPDTNYLFLGDYVDRGLYSVETISLLTCLKLRYPDRVQLVRGNHESRAVTQTYGFYAECIRKYGSMQVWKYFTDMFDYLTLSVVVDNSIFCVHGGLSPTIHVLDQIRIIDRFKEIPHEGAMADLVWSDPDPDKEEFAISARGAGYTFGSLVVDRFLHLNKMDHILRAHQLCNAGYQVLFDDKLSTVWSAPNYCYRCGNLASILEVSVSGERFFNVFDAAPENDRIIDTSNMPIKQSLEIILSNNDSKQIFYFLLLNLSYMFVQLTYGVWTNSLGLISDAIHMFFDCLALAVGLFAAVMSKWPSNSEFSYGYSRIETVAAFFNSVFLVLISLSIVTEAIQRLINPPHMSTHRLLFISFIGLLVNLVGIFAFNHGHAHGGHDHHHHGHDHGHNANMQGVFLHIMADTLGSIGVIVSTLLIQWFGWTGFDPIASIFIAVLIIASVIPLIRQSSAVMMLELDDATVAAVEGTLEELKHMDGVYSISHSRFWPCEAESVIGSVHVQVKDGVDIQHMRQNATELLKSHIHGLREVCVQIELQSAVKKSRFAVPQRGFFHTPTYTGPSMNNAYVNHRSTATSDTTSLTVTDLSLPSSSINTTMSVPAASNINANLPPPIMSVLQKQTKKE
ncbi:Metallo-dependent phosphatase-like protein [Parasitella parasitica]|nr:Metallo-dependent phosphatase-like protein [Parasitella parasitica]